MFVAGSQLLGEEDNQSIEIHKGQDMAHLQEPEGKGKEDVVGQQKLALHQKGEPQEHKKGGRREEEEEEEEVSMLVR